MSKKHKTKSDKDLVEVYWSPASYSPETESWSLLYPEPVNILSQLMKQESKGVMRQCPAVKDILKNVFSINSAIDDYSKLDPAELANKAYTDTLLEPISTYGKLPLVKERKSSYDNYINVSFNLSWIFFASEPVELKWTAPYFPASTPVAGALFSPGQMDIGSWFRSINLDMHIPINSTEYRIEKDQPLAFFEVMTDKRVVIKRFSMTPTLQNLAKELGSSSNMYGRLASLSERYKMAKRSKVIEIIKKEISSNLL